jgi:predicted component of type VI protein secretion system
MSITVKIFTKHGGRPTLFQTREFESLPVTLGRDPTCTVALEDPLKHISRMHVELEEEEGAYWLSVVSKVNPVMVKGHRHGPGSRVPLASGDSFEMGEFEVQVVFAEKRRPQPAPVPSPSLPGSLPTTVSPHEKKSLIEMLAADEPSAPAKEEIPPPEPGIFDEPTFIGGDEPTYIGPSTAKPAPVAAKPKSVPESASMKDAVRAFLDGAGMPHKDLSPAESEKLLRECGAILRASVEGLMMLLIARSEMRKEFEAQERTMVAARDNNPLKLMGEPQEAMDFLFDPAMRNEGFLEPVQAISDAAEDLRAHELALMAGMRAAILGAVRRFDPQVLEKAFAKSAGGFSLGGRKAKMWELFTGHQQKLAQDAQEDFNKVFGRDFMAAYEAQLRRLKSGH